jgi:hypothetical protein
LTFHGTVPSRTLGMEGGDLKVKGGL